MKMIATAWVLLSIGSILGCDLENEEAPVGKPMASVSTSAGEMKTRKTVRQSEKLLRTDERRVSVFVVPGDALVEVNGQRIERRDGVVDIVGKVGDVFVLRAWKGDKSSEPKEITIGETGANPALVDVYEVKPIVKNLNAKPKAARFNPDE